MKDNNMKTKLIATKEYLLLIDTGAEIRGGNELSFYKNNHGSEILCISYLSKTGVVFHELDVDPVEEYGSIEGGLTPLKGDISKILAYYPLTSEAKEFDLPLLPPFGEEVNFSKWYEDQNYPQADNNSDLFEEEITVESFKWSYMSEAFEAGYKAAQSRQFSLEDMKKAIDMATRINPNNTDRFYSKEEIIQSLSTQTSLPKIFIPEYEFECCNRYLNCKGCDATSEMLNKRLKTITNSEGKEEIQGTYKY